MQRRRRRRRFAYLWKWAMSGGDQNDAREDRVGGALGMGVGLRVWADRIHEGKKNLTPHHGAGLCIMLGEKHEVVGIGGPVRERAWEVGPRSSSLTQWQGWS